MAALVDAQRTLTAANAVLTKEAVNGIQERVTLLECKLNDIFAVGGA